MGPFGRNFGNDYDRDFGRQDWGNAQGRWGYGGGGWREGSPMRGNQGFGNGGYDRNFRDFEPQFRGGYDRGFRNDSHAREPFPIRPSHSAMPPSHHHGRGGYDVGYFGMDYDRDMRAGGRGYGGRNRNDINFGDFRNSYLSGWF